MFLIIRQIDSVIIGTAIKAINIDDASRNGYVVCEIPDEEFNPTMMGKKIEDFEQMDD